jgi:predicted dienelactone hydrolase
VVVALVACLSLIVAACSSGGSNGSSSDTTVASGPTDYAAPGPYPVGTVELSTGGADPKKIYVYYPADPARLAEGTPVTGYSSAVAFPEAFRAIVPPELIQDIPLDVTADALIADGPFPVVLYSHGFGSYPQYSAGHMAHLASWGMVAAAPDHTSRDLAAVATGQVTRGDADVVDLRSTLKVLAAENDGGGRFAGAIDTSKVAAEGHSAGGAAAAQLVYDDGIATFIGLAPASPLDLESSGPVDQAALDAAYADKAPPDKPSMIIAADSDIAIPLTSVRSEYAWLKPPKRLAVLADAGHNAFTDICAPIRAQGGLGQLATQLPVIAPVINLAQDGCTDGYLDPQTGYDVTNHLVVAQLRWVFGIDPTEASLAPDYVEAQFPGALLSYDSDPPVAGQG